MGGLTNFPNGVSSFGMPAISALLGVVPPKVWYVKPYTGYDGNNGKSPNSAFKTLSHALDKATANKNEVVFMVPESNTASLTSDYQSVALDWNKDGVHLIGTGNGSMFGHRSRIAQLSTATNVDNLFTLSADNCLIANIDIFHGVDDATSKIAMLASGMRNRIVNCQISGIGHATMDTAANCSLSLTGSENTFQHCVIGLDTISRATATYEINISGGCARNIFEDCVVPTMAGAAGFSFVNIPATGIDRFVKFNRCEFINAIHSTATTMTEAFAVAAGTSPNGLVLLKDCTFVGATDIEASGESARVYVDGAAPTNNTSALAVLAEAT